MKIAVGDVHIDGWGQRHTIVGAVPDKPGQFWSDTGYRWLEDGRLQFRVSPELSKFDLVDPMYADACHATLEFTARDPEQHEQQAEQQKPHNHAVGTDEQQNGYPI